jgi:DNA-binding GntR family transcriptional regulator
VLSASIEKSAGLTADGVAFTRTAREFHDLVVAFTPNATVRYVVSSLVALWSAQEEAWAEALTRRGEYPSVSQAESAVRTHRQIAEEIATAPGSSAATVSAIGVCDSALSQHRRAGRPKSAIIIHFMAV